MRFVDEAVITVRSGKGGHGCVSFRREKFIPKGGPDGGDGGDGGNILVRACSRLLSLYDFRLKRLYEAENGRPGEGSQCHGRKGSDLVIELPVGTQIYTLVDGRQERVLGDLATDGDELLIARGGRGGKGNEHFKSSTMRAPRFAQPGEPGEEFTLGLELKILADCGLLGLPNAGKSTFISKVSAARPKIANYAFTTLEPNLGVMIDDVNYDRRLVVADIPGLVEGAHTGYGLGHRFLKHVERTRFLVHILSVEDMSEEDPFAGFALLNRELEEFSPELADRRQIEVVNKIDLLSPERLQALKEEAAAQGRSIFFISAMNGENMEELVTTMWQLQDELMPNAPGAAFSYTERKAKEAAEKAASEGGGAGGDDEESFDIEVVYCK
ncbi:GTPase ObgE [Desulfovibrio sp. OttesenSCG-928-G15]|nr:GTPase ObgE [Desulfovibrio sp. OttesenSCG-928-G15]